jgi:hypothetical protein
MKVKVSGIDGRSGLDGLAAELDRAARVAPEETRKVTQKALLNIKQGWQRRWTGHPHLRALPSTITYDSKQTGDRIDGEVGPDRTRVAAKLANIAEYGSRNNAPVPGGAPALEEERPRYERALGDVAVRSLGWR